MIQRKVENRPNIPNEFPIILSNSDYYSSSEEPFFVDLGSCLKSRKLIIYK